MFLIICALIIITYLIGKIRSTRLNSIIGIIMLITFSALLAWRPTYFTDTKAYIRIFNQIDINFDYGFNPFGEILGVEYGYLYFMKFIKFFVKDVHLFFFIFNVFVSAIFMIGAKGVIEGIAKRKFNFAITLAVYMSYFGLYYMGIAIRQGMALSLSILGAALLKKKKYFLSGLALVFAFLFHRIAICSILTYIILYMFNKDYGKRMYLIIWSLCGVYMLFNSNTYLQDFFLKILYHIMSSLHLNSLLFYIMEGAKETFELSVVRVFLWLSIGLYISYSYICKINKMLLNVVFSGLIVSIVLYTLSGLSRIYDFYIIYSVIIMGCTYRDIPAYRYSVKTAFVDMSIMGIMMANMLLIYRVIFLGG